MKQTMEGLVRDLAELQELMEQLDPASTVPDDQIARKIFSNLIQQRKKSLENQSTAA